MSQETTLISQENIIHEAMLDDGQGQVRFLPDHKYIGPTIPKGAKGQYAIHLWMKAQKQNGKLGLHVGFNNRRNTVLFAVKGRFKSKSILLGFI
eukprot:6537905-Ditylum_brightwellii.AAC.2